MPAETLKYLAVSSDNIYVDCTTGEGGHSELILKKNSRIKLVCIEFDKELLKISRNRLEKYKNVFFRHANFSSLKVILKELKVSKVNGILFDLGLSTYHYKESLKGFSFNKNARLDMRLDTSQKLSAFDIVNFYSPKDLRKLIWTFGEEPWVNAIVRNIEKHRKKTRIKWTGQLKKIIEEAIPRKFWKKHHHPATRTFQALRIAVNHELSNLENALEDAIKLLTKKGRIVVISYHSLEDRIVKNIFRLYSSGYDEKGIEHENKKGILNVLTKKPVRPDSDEVKNNRSSRSAKLRCAELN